MRSFIISTSLAFLLFFGLAAANPVIEIEDVIITEGNGSIHCDQVVCPQGSVRCEVIKHRSENGETSRRQNICYDTFDNVLHSLRHTFSILNNDDIETYVVHQHPKIPNQDSKIKQLMSDEFFTTVRGFLYESRETLEKDLSKYERNIEDQIVENIIAVQEKYKANLTSLGLEAGQFISLNSTLDFDKKVKQIQKKRSDLFKKVLKKLESDGKKLIKTLTSTYKKLIEKAIEDAQIAENKQKEEAKKVKTRLQRISKRESRLLANSPSQPQVTQKRSPRKIGRQLLSKQNVQGTE